MRPSDKVLVFGITLQPSMRINANVSPHLPELKINYSILTVTKNVLDTADLLYSVQNTTILYRP